MRGDFIMKKVQITLSALFLSIAAGAAPISCAEVPAPDHGPNVDACIRADQITASSTLEDGSGYNYSTECLQDFNANTAWVEGTAGDGTGETLTYSFPEGTVLTGGVIYTGYQKSEHLLHANGAPNAYRVESGDRSESLFLDSYADTFLGNEKEGYLFWFDEPMIPDHGKVTVTITSVRPGWKYQDTCISEFRFCGYQRNSSESAQETADSAAFTLSEGQCAELSRFGQYACSIVMGNSFQEDTVRADSLTAQQQAFLLYWYQYNVTDERVAVTAGEWNRAAKADLEEILREMFGSALKEETLSVFLSDYADHMEGETVCMSGTGDFGDVGLYYFEPADEYWMEDGLIAVRGRVMGWNKNMQSYVHQDMYTGYFAANPSPSGKKTAYRLDHVTIGF